MPNTQSQNDDWNLATPNPVQIKPSYEELTEAQKKAAAPSKACLLNDPDCEACQ